MKRSKIIYKLFLESLVTTIQLFREISQNYSFLLHSKFCFFRWCRLYRAKTKFHFLHLECDLTKFSKTTIFQAKKCLRPGRKNAQKSYFKPFTKKTPKNSKKLRFTRIKSIFCPVYCNF